MKTPDKAEKLHEQIMTLDLGGCLFAQAPDSDSNAVPLTTRGKRVIGKTVKFCLENGHTPKCSANGDTSETADIRDLSRDQFNDIIKILNHLIGQFVEA